MKHFPMKIKKHEPLLAEARGVRWQLEKTADGNSEVIRQSQMSGGVELVPYENTQEIIMNQKSNVLTKARKWAAYWQG